LQELFLKYPDFTSLASAPLRDIEKIIRSTGFYRVKAANIKALSRSICEKHKGSIPATSQELTSLPGVGRKSANVILSIGFGIPALAVDTHVARISFRLGYTEHKNPDNVEKDLCTVIPEADWKKTHLLFIKHGRSLCTARNPRCSVCPVNAFCRHFRGISLAAHPCKG